MQLQPSSSVWKPTGRPAYLLSLRAAWMADNKKPNSLEASMSKAKAGRTGTDVTLKAVELAGTYGYSQRPLLEKWGPRLEDSRHLRGHPADPAADRRTPALLGKSSAELK